ncbi:DUF4199 domain-containing protein [Sphingobacterium sp. SG20118]|uniref:DUF4199 domain-containing protein n=1 Tax=Sphingobacterium TaxID=28453 RepID=UPI0004F5F9D8|nr:MULTISPECIES: DUF4199 domain-containing protein [Sphingobacterium]AIM36461.1 hypothetical protein KO02_06915 [Sphingobacterium sp. ML3W]MDH5827400.1 DUF4199 domain-containing protein [Sphingobacterium faecium]
MEVGVDKNSKITSIVYGVVLGVTSFVLGLFSIYSIKPLEGTSLLQFINPFFNFILFFGVTVLLTFSLRKKMGGIWDFTKAVKCIYIMLVINHLVASVSTFSYLSYFEPTIQEENFHIMMNARIESMENSTAFDSEEEKQQTIDMSIEQMEKDNESVATMTLGARMKGFVITLLPYFLFALLLAALTKNGQKSIGNPTV